MKTAARHVIVHGRVQGVGFRYFVRRAGARLGLTGNVLNRSDGTVEITVEGDEDAIVQFLGQVSEGPPSSRIERLDTEEITPSGSYRSFQIEGW